MEQKRCSRCREAKDRALFGRDKTRRDGLNVYCRQCANQKSAAYFAANPDAVRRIKLAYDRRNGERIAQWRRENAAALKAYWAAYGREYRQENKAAVAEKARREQAARRRAVPMWFDRDKAAAIYEEAARLRELGHEVEVDHIFPINGEAVCGLHWHGNLQILPALLNRSKGNKVDPNAAPLFGSS